MLECQKIQPLLIHNIGIDCKNSNIDYKINIYKERHNAVLNKDAKAYNIREKPAVTGLCHAFYRWEQQITPARPLVNVMVLQHIEYDPGPYGVPDEMYLSILRNVLFHKLHLQNVDDISIIKRRESKNRVELHRVSRGNKYLVLNLCRQAIALVPLVAAGHSDVEVLRRLYVPGVPDDPYGRVLRQLRVDRFNKILIEQRDPRITRDDQDDMLAGVR